MTMSKIAFGVVLIVVIFLKSVRCGFTTTKIGRQPIWNSTHTDKLRQDLLLNYDKFARPAQHYNTTTVKFGITIRHVEVNEFKSTLIVHSWVRMSWEDEKLKWDTEEYGGITALNLADHEIWQPDLFLYNSAISTAINHYGNTHFIVYDNGQVLWVPPAQFAVLCNFDLKYWPFDTQECHMKFGSWTYNGDQIDIIQMEDDVEIKELLVRNSEWQCTKATMQRTVNYYPCCKEPYPDVTVNLTLIRTSPSYKAIIVTPAFVVIILTLMIFWLPPQAGEKVVLTASTAIIVSLFLLYFSQKIPAMGNNAPLIVLFYSSCLYVIGFSTIGSVLVIWLSRTKHTHPLPWVIKKVLTGIFGKILGLTSYIQQSSLTTHTVTAEEMRDHQVTDFDETNSGDEHHIIRSSNKLLVERDWILLAAAIDRISFYFYLILFIILTIIYSI